LPEKHNAHIPMHYIFQNATSVFYFFSHYIRQVLAKFPGNCFWKNHNKEAPYAYKRPICTKYVEEASCKDNMILFFYLKNIILKYLVPFECTRKFLQMLCI
jgi:hypothetical protein